MYIHRQIHDYFILYFIIFYFYFRKCYFRNHTLKFKVLQDYRKPGSSIKIATAEEYKLKC